MNQLGPRQQAHQILKTLRHDLSDQHEIIMRGSISYSKVILCYLPMGQLLWGALATTYPSDNHLTESIL